eukprot:CAMPEP_0119142844 /NCGR_PEP_ID=MMETSP1310-20130426/33378_1 /TAXON_ID=464262 /ORGANISM="Genus nov. species nov., Strain RCC2339" /LENGTH=469 /DNA_ID=CAMNT_0007134419 /DNA_START=27 /DNA_END=1436 /DNA_ORIENTATION=+
MANVERQAKRRKMTEEYGEEDDNHPLQLIPHLCKLFYDLGWCTGTGGGMSIKHGDEIYIAPSGVQKERIKGSDLFVFNVAGEVVRTPGDGVLKPSACTPLFFNAFKMRDAGAVLHSHAQEVALITLLFPGKEFRISRLEMIKGVAGHGYEDTLVVPIVENTPYEEQLTTVMAEAIEAYPKSCAVLVRRHGIYVWGKTWEKAKGHAECLHYLFKLILDAHARGIHLAPVYPRPEVVLLDIEGTTTSIRFVKDTLFPLARQKMYEFLTKRQHDSQVQALLQEVREVVVQQAAESLTGHPFVNYTVVEYVTHLHRWMDEDRKEGSLKALQGLIWEAYYESGDVKGHLYDDVPDAMRGWKEQNIRIAIYSSGSVRAQKLLFRHSTAGDLTPLISDYFDTTTGHKREVASYHAISANLGVDPAKILFLSDIKEELDAAVQAGFQTHQLFRDGVPPYLYNYRHPIVNTFREITLG